MIRGLNTEWSHGHSEFGWIRTRVVVWLCLLCAFRPGLLPGLYETLASVPFLAGNCLVEFSIC